MSDAVAELKELGAATVIEAQGQKGVVDSAIVPLYRPIAMAGPAYTVAAPAGDNLPIHLAIAEAPAGAVLVVTCGGDRAYACIGDIMAQACMARGLAGFVTDGMVRDARQIREMGFPTFCRGTQIRGPGKQSPGRRGELVRLGGVEVRAGDLVVGDDDGLAVVRAGDLQATLAAAKARQARERQVVERIAKGETTVEILGLKAG